VALTGAAIASSCGTTGTLGTLARTRHDGLVVLLSSWHVLYGGGSAGDSDVWLVDGGRRSVRLGRTLFGKAGTVAFDGAEIYIDCAVASCDLEPEGDVRGHDTARPGDRVTKRGAATGVTTGIVVRTDYDEVAWIGGRPHPAARQLLIRPLDGDRPFSAAGDSGALLVNEAGNAVGLLWGATHRGEGVASPIAPVLYAMNIAFSVASTIDSTVASSSAFTTAFTEEVP
jgi:hypothetical protein